MLRPPWPRAWWYASATFIAVSTASEPELTKKMRLRSPGVSSATRDASWNCLGCPRVKGAMKSSSRSCAPTASAISLRPCPALTQNSPEEPSMILSSRSFHKYIPSARTTILGSRLKSRLGVKGIQYSSSESWCDWTCSLGLVSAWAMRLSPVVARSKSLRGGAAAARTGCATILRHSYRIADTASSHRRIGQCSSPIGSTMRIGVPKEIKVLEHRVGLTPESVREVCSHGHQVTVETRAGEGIGMNDDAYRRAGATVASSAEELFAVAEMIVKVKEPLAGERKMLKQGQVLFTYLHLAPDPEQARDLVESGAVCIAYETVTSPSGGLPLLAPMSEVAGRMAI